MVAVTPAKLGEKRFHALYSPKISNPVAFLPPKTNMTIAGTSSMNEDVWILLKNGEFPAIVMLVNSGVYVWFSRLAGLSVEGTNIVPRMEIGKMIQVAFLVKYFSIRYKKESDMGIRHIYACLLGCVFDFLLNHGNINSRLWFQRFLIFFPLPGEMIQSDDCASFSNGLVQPPTRKWW